MFLVYFVVDVQQLFCFGGSSTAADLAKKHYRCLTGVWYNVKFSVNHANLTLIGTPWVLNPVRPWCQCLYGRFSGYAYCFDLVNVARCRSL
jgi:hypothetical protein